MSSLPPSKFHIPRFTRRPGWFLLLGVLLALGLILTYPRRQAATQSPAHHPPMPPFSALQPTPASDALARLARPPILSNVPAQLNRGAEVYWGVCMACHGDRGQGLTDEWRSVYGADSNCWASGCHGKDHPTPGFEIPKTLTIPPVAGPGALARFSNAYELYEYIYATMPWWNPGFLTKEDAWALTAHLLRMNNVWPQGIVLNAQNAAAVPVHRLVGQYQNDTLPALVLAGLLTLAGISLVWQQNLELKTAMVGETPRRPHFFLHLHPPTIPAAQARLRYTLGAGGLAVFFSLVLLITGALEMVYYSPTPEKAAISVGTITYFVPFGGVIRGLHFWSAQALLIIVSIHLLRVILTGAYRPPRHLNYLIGLGLFILIFLLDFTGYILRWDQGIQWALVVGTNLLKTIPFVGEKLHLLVVGGSNPGPGVLIRFYAWHVFLLTLGVLILGIWHIFRVRRDGGIAIPSSPTQTKTVRITRQELFARESLAMLIAGAGLIFLAVLFPAPLAPPIVQVSAAVSEGRAPWFFLWVQQLLKVGNPFLFGVLIPVMVFLVFAAIPFLLPLPAPEEIGHWFPPGGRLVQVLILLLISSILILTFLATFR